MRYHGQLRLQDEYCSHTGKEDLYGKRIGGEEMGIFVFLLRKYRLGAEV